jgi:hypothetical protein
LFVVLGSWTMPARADNLDLKLLDHANGLVRECRERGWRNVGTIKFQAKLEGQPTAPPLEPLASNLADRLENLLVIASEVDRLPEPKREERPELNIIRAAGEAAAAKDAHAGVLTLRGRKALFEYPYPLAWGNTKVSADAFLTGEVEFAADLRTVRVRIDCFDRSGVVKKLLAFQVEADRSLLSDAGLAFQLERTARRTKGPAGLDQAAVAAAVTRLKEPPSSPKFRSEFVQVGVVVDGKVQPTEPTRCGGAVPAPRIGRSVTVRLKNLTAQRLGVLLKVGGRNSVGEGIDEGVRSRRWLLEPEKEYTIRGYRLGDGVGGLRPFKLPSGTPRAELIPDTGEVIEIQVFLLAEPEEKSKKVSLRGLSAAERSGSGAWSFRELQSRLVRRCGLRKVTARTVEPDETIPSIQDELSGAMFAEYRRIRVETVPGSGE